MLLFCPTTSYLSANRAVSDIASRVQRVTWPFTWLKDNVLPLYYRAASLSPDTNVEWCKIKAQSDCYIQSNNCRKIPISKPTLKPHEVQLYEYSQNKIHLFVLENTVDLLCKPYRWILSLCTVQRIALAQGSTFPVTMKKTFTAPIILYPCVAPENTITATVNEIIAMGE